MKANCSLGCPAVVGCSRRSGGNTHGSLLADRHCRCSRACRRWSVNPSRKLRRFESFTGHHVIRGSARNSAQLAECHLGHLRFSPGLNSAGSSRKFSAPPGLPKLALSCRRSSNPQRREVQQLGTATRLTSTGLSCLRAPRSVLKQAWVTAIPRACNEGVRGLSPQLQEEAPGTREDRAIDLRGLRFRLRRHLW